MTRTSISAQPVTVWRHVKSGKAHRVELEAPRRINGVHRYSFCGINLDHFETVPLSRVAPEDLCKRCWRPLVTRIAEAAGVAWATVAMNVVDAHAGAMDRLTRALNAARELWHLATLALGDWWEERLDPGDDDEAWLESVLERHDEYLGRPNP